jgi:hypothetical protein
LLSLPFRAHFLYGPVQINRKTTMTGQTKIIFLADRILDDLRMIPRTRALLDRITANAGAYCIAKKSLPAPLHCAWERLTPAAVAFCQRLASRYNRVVTDEDFRSIDPCGVVFDDKDIATLKLFLRDPRCSSVTPEAFDIVRQCRHIQVLAHVASRLEAVDMDGRGKPGRGVVGSRTGGAKSRPARAAKLE